jgi:hypothetical protein
MWQTSKHQSGLLHGETVLIGIMLSANCLGKPMVMAQPSTASCMFVDAHEVPSSRN